MAAGYYYIISLLPELSLNDKNKSFEMVHYRDFVIPMLESEDVPLMKILFYNYDIQNLVNLMLQKDYEWNLAGNYTQEEMTEGMKQPDLLPEFLQKFIENNAGRREKHTEKQLINEATWLFVDWCKQIENPFLKRWMRFENNLKNLLIWLNSHKFKLNPTLEVLGSHYEAEYLRKVDKDQIHLKSWDYHFKDVLTHYDNPNIAVREFIIDEMRWKFLNELEEQYAFGIERLLGFAIRLQIINRNISATEDGGKERLTNLLSDMRLAYVMPESF